MRARVEPSGALLYYADDNRIPSTHQERRIYFRNAREFLLNEVVEAYAYMRDSGTASGYMEWKKGRRNAAGLPDGRPPVDTGR